MIKLRSALSCLSIALFLAFNTEAEEISPQKLEAALAELRELQRIQADTAERIAALEDMLNADMIASAPISVAPSSSPPDAIEPAPIDMAFPATSPLNVTADMMVRFEGNYGGSLPDRERGVMRARLGATYQVDPRLKVGALLETGDPDDPNSGYLTFDEFTDDFTVSLSRAYMEYQIGALTLSGGKFPKPFRSTDLLWDGDVNPSGLAIRTGVDLTESVRLDLSGLASIIDENASGADSHMIGGQTALSAELPTGLQLAFALGYYDYELNSLAGADAGDFLNNLLTPNGEYLSDFDLLDLIVTLEWLAWSEEWPVWLTINYVENLGAEVSADRATGIDLGIGRSASPGDLKFMYGYAEAGVDSVLGAFSHDNYALSTNYMSHELGVHYLLTDRIWLGGSLYHYKPLDAQYAGRFVPDEWHDRLRLNIGVAF